MNSGKSCSNLPKSLHQVLHVDLLFPLLAHHPEELIELYCAVQLVLTHRSDPLQQVTVCVRKL